MLASSAHLRCTSRGQLKRATPHASSTLTDSEAQVRFQYLTPHATANIRLSLGTEDQLHLGVKDEPHTNARRQTRAKQYTMDGFTKPRLMLQMLHHKLQQRSSHDVPPGTKKTQTARPKDLRITTRRVNCDLQTANARGSLTQWHVETMTTLCFDQMKTCGSQVHTFDNQHGN